MMEYGLFPIWSGWISQEFSSKHKGIDIGALKADGDNLPVRAWNDGIVLASGTDADGGVYVVLKHANGQWTGYWHLVTGSNIAKGKKVEQGDTIGIRGNTGKSSGVHLHFILTKENMTEGFTINKMNNNAIDPLPHCYKLKSDNIEKAENHDQYPLPIKPDLPKPVARNTEVHQVQVLADSLRVRKKASTSAEIVGICKQGLFNVLRQAQGSYLWDKIGEDCWIATSAEKGWTRDFPADSEYKQEIEELNKTVSDLTEKVATLADANKTLETSNADLTAKNKTLTSKNKSLTSQLATTKTSLETAEKRISDAVGVLTV